MAIYGGIYKMSIALKDMDNMEMINLERLYSERTQSDRA